MTTLVKMMPEASTMFFLSYQNQVEYGRKRINQLKYSTKYLYTAMEIRHILAPNCRVYMELTTFGAPNCRVYKNWQQLLAPNCRVSMELATFLAPGCHHSITQQSFILEKINHKSTDK